MSTVIPGRGPRSVARSGGRREPPILTAGRRQELSLGKAQTLGGAGPYLARPVSRRACHPVGAENLCHLGRCPADGDRLSLAFDNRPGRSWPVRRWDDLRLVGLKPVFLIVSRAVSVLGLSRQESWWKDAPVTGSAPASAVSVLFRSRGASSPLRYSRNPRRCASEPNRSSNRAAYLSSGPGAAGHGTRRVITHPRALSRHPRAYRDHHPASTNHR
jgi:hypothetical protein